MTVTVDEFEVADPAGRVDPSRLRHRRRRRLPDRRRRYPAGRTRPRHGHRRVVVARPASDGAIHDLDGVPTTRSDAAPAVPATHPNGVIAIDHVVLLSPDLDRTVESLAAIGVAPRRERDGELGGRPIRQIFFRFGEVIVEVVGSPDAAGEGPSTLWGMTYVVADIDATAAFFGDRTAPVKDAVQPGRRITTLRHHEFGMSVRTALISAPARSLSRPLDAVPILGA